MLKTYLSKLFNYACLVIFVGALFLFVNKVSNGKDLYVHISSELSFPSKTSKALLDIFHSPLSNPSSNENIFLVLEEEFGNDDEVTKRNCLPVLTLTNLFRSFYSKEIRTPFFIFQPAGYTTSSIPLHIRNCTFLI